MSTNTDLLKVTKLDGQAVLRGLGTVEGKQFQVDNLKNCSVFVFDYCDSVVIDDCSNCNFVIGPTSGSVFIRDCDNCTLAVASQQLRTRDCKKISISLFCPSEPVVETSTEVNFAPLNVAIPNGNVLLEKAGLKATDANLYSKVHDFSKSDENIPQPHFTTTALEAAKEIIAYDLLPEEEGGETQPGQIPDSIKSAFPADVAIRRVKVDGTGNEVSEKAKEAPKEQAAKEEPKEETGGKEAPKATEEAAETPSDKAAEEKAKPKLIGEEKPASGKVKWYSQKKGFGYATTTEGLDVSIPRTAVPKGMKLVADAEVEMTIGETEKGWRSLTVTKCTPPPEDPDKKEDDNGGVADPEAEAERAAAKKLKDEERRERKKLKEKERREKKKEEKREAAAKKEKDGAKDGEAPKEAETKGDKKDKKDDKKSNDKDKEEDKDKEQEKKDKKREKREREKERKKEKKAKEKEEKEKKEKEEQEKKEKEEEEGGKKKKKEKKKKGTEEEKKEEEKPAPVEATDKKKKKKEKEAEAKKEVPAPVDEASKKKKKKRGQNDVDEPPATSGGTRLPGTSSTGSPTSNARGKKIHVMHYTDERHQQMKTFLNESDMYVKTLDNRQMLRRQIEFDPTSILIAVEDEVIIGTVYVLYNPWQAFIYHLCVHPEHRNKSVANLLMDRAEVQLKARGVHCPTLFVEAGNKTVSAFYEKRGWFATDHCLCMGKDL
jgi:cold shock CspA family protein/GNAT superfamily N-acetyltransferase